MALIRISLCNHFGKTVFCIQEKRDKKKREENVKKDQNFLSKFAFWVINRENLKRFMKLLF